MTINANSNTYCPECAHDLYPQDNGACFECGWDPSDPTPDVSGCDGCTDPDCGFHDAVDPYPLNASDDSGLCDPVSLGQSDDPTLRGWISF